MIFFRINTVMIEPREVNSVTHGNGIDLALQSEYTVIENVKSVELLRPRKASYPWTGETHFRVTPDACGNSVFRTSARILVPLNAMNPMAIADSGASHAILPQTALFDSKAAKPVNLRLALAAGEINAVEAHRETFAVQANPKHVLASFDVSNAFLNAELSEDVIILTQPAPELVQFGLVKPGTLYQCTKACYGLREAPKLWEEARDKTLTSFVFQIDHEEYSLRPMVCCLCTRPDYL